MWPDLVDHCSQALSTEDDLEVAAAISMRRCLKPQVGDPFSECDVLLSLESPVNTTTSAHEPTRVYP